MASRKKSKAKTSKKHRKGKKRKLSAAHLKKLLAGAKRARAGKKTKKCKAAKKHAAPKRKARKAKKSLSRALFLRRMAAGRKAAAARRAHEGPILRAEIGESARPAWAKPSMGRHPIRNPPGNYWKLIIHKGRRIQELIGRGPRSKAEHEAKSIMRNVGATHVELFGPYRTESQALAA